MNKKPLRKLSLILSALILASCCAEPVYLQGKLKLPPKLVYEPISAESLQCLSDEAYTKLNARRAACEARIETLRAIIRSTH